MMMIFKKKLLIIVHMILVLSLESAYAADILTDKRDLEFEAKVLRSYSEEQLLEIISEKVKKRQELLKESSDSPLIHYISTVQAVSVSSTIVFRASKENAEDGCNNVVDAVYVPRLGKLLLGRQRG